MCWALAWLAGSRPGGFAETVERFGLARGIASLAVQGTNLAGISNNGVIVGFYTDSTAINHGFELTPAR